MENQNIPEKSVKTSTTNIPACLLILALVVLTISIIIMGSVPPTSRDALTHHLAVPKLWIEQGGIYEIPQLVFSYYPMNLDLLYVLPMLAGNDIVPKYIHFFFALATAWLIYRYLKQRTTFPQSLLGALIFLSTPMIVKLSINVYVDLGLIFFSWASIFHLFAWSCSLQSPKHLIFSAIICGLGLGTKYNGMIVLFLLTLFVPILYSRTNGDRHLKTKTIFSFPILFFLVAITVFSPWMIRNYRLTGNPVYPLYNQLITGEPTDEISMQPWLQRKLIYKETALEIALIPMRVFFQGQDDDPKHFDGKLNPVLFFFPFLAFIGFKRQAQKVKAELLVLGGFSILYLLYASFMVDMRIRYISPILPPLVILTVLGMKKAYAATKSNNKRKEIVFKILLTLVIGFFLYQNCIYVQSLFRAVNPVSYLSGKVSRDIYIEQFRPEYPVIQTANQLPGDEVKILALFVGNRRYYFDKDVAFSLKTFKDTVDTSEEFETLSTTLKRSGYTHVFLGIDHFKSWAMNTMQSEKQTLINAFFESGCRLIESKNGYALFQIGA